MLETKQIRRLVFLGCLFLISVALLYRYVNMGSGPRSRPDSRPAPGATGGSVEVGVQAPAEEAPPPPPSPFPEGSAVLGGKLRGVTDFTHFKELDREKPYRDLVDHVLSLSDEALRNSSEGEIPYATYLKYPAELRGRAFRVVGRAIDPVLPVRLSEPVGGREDVYRLFLYDLTGRTDGGFVVDLVERPPPIEKGDDLRIDGLFLKVSRYENQSGKFRDAPVLVARTFEREVSAPSEESGTFFAIKILVVVGIALTLLIGYLLFRRMANTQYPSPRARPRNPGQPPISKN